MFVVLGAGIAAAATKFDFGCNAPTVDANFAFLNFDINLVQFLIDDS
jgi:hypothetical protein